MYVVGKRDDRKIVIKGSEKPEIIKPYRILLKNGLERIRDYFQIYQYEASRRVAESLLSKSWFILEDEENRRLHDMKEILDGFMSWERFDHENALAHFRQVNFLFVEKQKEYLDKVMVEGNRIRARYIQLYKSTEQSQDKKKKKA